MDKTEAADIMREFSENRQLSTSGEDRRWRFTPGTFLFPEGRCCYCGEAVRSNRLWALDAVGGGRLFGQLNVAGKTAVFEKPEHPHAGTDGVLCTGGHDVLTALFFGVNPGDVIRRGMDIKEWYRKMFDHECGKQKLKPANALFVERATRREDAPICGCECECSPRWGHCGCGHEECLCDDFECHECGEVYNADERHPSDITGHDYCESCFYERFAVCDHCGREMRLADDIHVGDEQGLWCPDHATVELRAPRRPTRHALFGTGTGGVTNTTFAGTWTATTTADATPAPVVEETLDAILERMRARARRLAEIEEIERRQAGAQPPEPDEPF